MNNLALSLSILPATFAVFSLDPRTQILSWVTHSDFFSITRTDDPLSIVCCQSAVPNGIRCERAWRCLKVDGPLDVSLTGILASLGTALADAGISIYAISTFETDYLLVKEKNLHQTIAVLQNTGRRILEISRIENL